MSKVLSEISHKLSGPTSREEMFDGTGWKQFRTGMEAEFELHGLTQEEKVK